MDLLQAGLVGGIGTGPIDALLMRGEGGGGSASLVVVTGDCHTGHLHSSPCLFRKSLVRSSSDRLALGRVAGHASGMALTGEERLRYGVGRPAIAQAAAGAISAFGLSLGAYPGAMSSEGYSVFVFFGLPTAFVLGLVLDGVVSLFHWNRPGRLFASAVVIGLLPLLAVWLWAAGLIRL